MLAVLALVIATLSLVLGAAIWLRVKAIAQASEALPAPIVAKPLPQPLETPSPLSGLRISLQIEQDHPQPVIEGLLREQLLKADAEIVSWDEADLRITGVVTCNGYSDIYYEACLTCATAGGDLCTVSEKPPHGDRPTNLALEVVTRIESELAKLISRNERRRALRELGS